MATRDVTGPVCTGLRCDHMVDPLGIDSRQPWLSWQFRSAETPEAVRVEARDGATGDPRWDSGWVAPAPLGVRWGGSALADRQAVTWRVRARREAAETEPAPWASFERALTDEAEWRGQWMEAHGCLVPLLRSRFALDRGRDALVAARWYVAVGGMAELRCNGRRVGAAVLAPDHTDYCERVGVLTVDLAPHLVAGENAVGVILGGGWYERHGYGHRCFRSQVELTWEDGSRQVAATTHADWCWAAGPWTVADVYNGEEVDGRAWPRGWDTAAGGAASGWTRLRGVGLETPPAGGLHGLLCEPMRVHEDVGPVSVSRPAPGSRVFDFGHNLCGWCALGGGEPGTTVTLRFSERLGADGRVDMADLRSARATDRYTFGGDETWEPRFTYHGFRYCEATGDEAALGGVRVTARRLASPLGAGCGFTCGHAGLERLVSATERSLRGNAVGLLSDCPSRDERQGWLGDGHAIVETFLLLTDGAALVAKWLQDMLATQSRTGARWANMAPPWPSRCHPDGRDTWGRKDVARYVDTHPRYQADLTYTVAPTLVAEALYRWTGDPSPLDGVLAAFAAHLDFLSRRPGWPAVRSDSRHRNVLACDAAGNSRPDPVDKAFFDGAFVVLELRSAERLARATGRGDLAQRCAGEAAALAAVLVATFYDRGARSFGSQNADGLALETDLLPRPERPAFRDALVTRIEDEGHRPRCHMLCGRYLLEGLSRHGARETACRMVTVTGRPGWLDLAAGSGGTLATHFDPSRGSLNHPALGFAAGWVLRWLAGIRLETGEPGRLHLTVDPWLPAGIDRLDVALPTPAGTIRVAGRRDGDDQTWEHVIPAGVRRRSPAGGGST